MKQLPFLVFAMSLLIDPARANLPRSASPTLTLDQTRIEMGKVGIFSDSSGWINVDGAAAKILFERLAVPSVTVDRVEHKMARNMICNRTLYPVGYQCLIPIQKIENGAIGSSNLFHEIDKKYKETNARR